MKCKIIGVSERSEEQVIVYATEHNPLAEEIARLAASDEIPLFGMAGNELIKINPTDVICFITEGEHVIALTKKGRLRMRSRLYQLEELCAKSFIKLNQSCLANVSMIEKFDTSLAGTLTVTFKGGYRDYVSRRQVKNVKKRMGIK